MDASIVVLMLPFPAQGHLNSLLHFSRLIALRGFRVVFLGSSTHNRQAKLRLEGWDLSFFAEISFADLPLPPFSTPDPDPECTNKFPSHLQPSWVASQQLRGPIDLLLQSFAASYRRVVIVHDSLMSFAAELASNYPNVETFAYGCVSAFFNLFFYQHRETQVQGIKPNLDLLPLQGCFTDEFFKFGYDCTRYIPLTKGELFNTFDEIEGEFIDMFSGKPSFENRKIWSIGPVIPLQMETVSHQKSYVFNWLDKQPAGSVLYLSFGSCSSLSSAQISQLAIGLERSGQRFLWVLRTADRGDIFAKQSDCPKIDQLPEGFEQRVEGVGLVVREFAPQLCILNHAAIGGFMSHCGWNSCMESISMGVPLATWPLHSDQPANAQLVTEVLKIGVVIREWGRNEDVVPADQIEKAVRRLMVENADSVEIRKRSAKLRDAARRASSQGGSSYAALDSFAEFITRP